MLSVQSLSCRRGGRMLFRDVSFSVAAGGFLWLRGANGSGKSSLLRILSGLIMPHDGAVHWNGADVNEDPTAHRARMHYIGHLDAVKPELTPGEMIEYWRAISIATENDVAKVALDPRLRGDDDTLQFFELQHLAQRPIRALSAGQKRRLSLSRLFICPAPLWLLDEPTTALDNEGQVLLWRRIEAHRGAGGIVIAAAHDEPAVANMQLWQMGGA